MNIIEFDNGLKQKILKARSAEEVKEIAAADGREIDAEAAERIFQEIEHHRTDADLSVDELEAVSSGRDWPTQGCAATVEPGSNDKHR